MLDEIITTWQEGKDKLPKGPVYTCKYCKKDFKKESTLSVHQCESKRRWQQEKEVSVQLGLQSYLRFYVMSQGSAKLKSYADFVESPYYTAFVKFGRHLVGIRAVNASAFIDYVIKQNKKLDQWCHELIYLGYLHQHLRKEAVQDALERALLEMQEYSDEAPELLTGFSNYFTHGNTNRICQHIINGRVSPWVVFNCKTGIAFLERLNEDQIHLIISTIEPDYWNRKFKDYTADAEWVKSILVAANL